MEKPLQGIFFIVGVFPFFPDVEDGLLSIPDVEPFQLYISVTLLLNAFRPCFTLHIYDVDFLDP